MEEKHMNYTVLVVDDEENQRRALIEKVDWARAGFEVIGEAENGVEALPLVEMLEPDLVMTDIRMLLITVEKGELPSVCFFISMRYIFAALRRKNLSLMNKFSLNMHFCL